MARYNGYYNWETWNVRLWLGNDEGLYSYCRDVKGETMSYQEAENLVRELMPNGPPDFDSANEYDLVDWSEVADCILEF